MSNGYLGQEDLKRANIKITGSMRSDLGASSATQARQKIASGLRNRISDKGKIKEGTFESEIGEALGRDTIRDIAKTIDSRGEVGGIGSERAKTLLGRSKFEPSKGKKVEIMKAMSSMTEKEALTYIGKQQKHTAELIRVSNALSKAHGSDVKSSMNFVGGQANRATGIGGNNPKPGFAGGQVSAPGFAGQPGGGSTRTGGFIGSGGGFGLKR